MAMVSNLSLPLPPETIEGKQREASFSSFLNAAEENFIRNLANKEEEDGEIGVFRAEKYFNGGMDDEAPRKLQFEKIAEKLDLESMAKSKIQPGTPSVRSDFSWNSQSALLQSVQKIPAKSRKNRRKSFLSLCKCSCCDKTSVDVMEEPGDLKSLNPGESRGDEFKIIEPRSWFKEGIGETFTFPISKPESGNFPLRSPEEELEFSAINGGLYGDASSDGSSDLFEIESLTGKSSHFHGRQSSDSTSCFTPTTCYAPSEVSIEWSVATASAADFSTASDYDSDQKAAAVKPGNPVQKRRSGILLGCKNEKAVGVAMEAYRKYEKSCSDGSGRVVGNQIHFRH